MQENALPSKPSETLLDKFLKTNKIPQNIKKWGGASFKPEFSHHQCPPCWVVCGFWSLLPVPPEPPREQSCLPKPSRGCCLQPEPFPLFSLRLSHQCMCPLQRGFLGASVGDSALQEHELFPKPGFNKALPPRGCCLGLVWLSGLDEALLNSARGRKVES